MFICVCLSAPIKTKLGTGIDVDSRSVLVKVKVIYLCVRYNRIHDRIRDRKFMSAPSANNDEPRATQH